MEVGPQALGVVGSGSVIDSGQEASSDRGPSETKVGP